MSHDGEKSAAGVLLFSTTVRLHEND